MKILLVNECPTGIAGSGGVEIHVQQLYEALMARGEQAHILASQQRGQPRKQTSNVLLIPSLRTPPLRKHFIDNYLQHHKALKDAASHIKQLKPDVIHIHNLMDPGALHMLLTCGIPVIKSIHDCRPFCTKPPPTVASRLIGDSETFCDISFGKACWNRCYAHSGKTLMQRIESWSYYPYNLKALGEIAQADQFIVYSQYLNELALRKIDDTRRIHVLPLFTDAEQVASSAPVAKPEGPPIFLFSGRLSVEKGVLKIFDALDKIPQVPCKLVIAGDGPNRDAVQRRIEHCHPAHTIEMVGFLEQPRLYEQYQAASVLLLPAIGSEGCSLSGIEAMYFGTTAIGFDSGGIPEWLVDGKTGILLPRGDIDGLAAAISKLATQPKRIAALGREAQEFVRKKFTRSAHIDRLLDIYQTAIQDDRNTQRTFA